MPDRLVRVEPYGFRSVALKYLADMPALGQFVAIVLWLGGCAAPTTDEGIGRGEVLPTPPVIDARQYVEFPSPGLECVPYARDHSGIGIFGDAYRWWDIAAEYFMRGPEPIPGAVLVLERTRRLRFGHLAVVARVFGPRQILVDHANWIPGRIVTGMPVVDVSPDNDWTLLRFWNKESAAFGAIYRADGFIYNPGTIALGLASPRRDFRTRAVSGGG